MIYVPSKTLRHVAICVLLCGLVGIGYQVFFPKPPSTILEQRDLVKPLEQVSAGEQVGVGGAQTLANRLLHQAGAAAVWVDTGRLIELEYPPIHITPQPNLSLMLGYHMFGYTTEAGDSFSRRLGEQHYQLINTKTGALVWEDNIPVSNDGPVVGQEQGGYVISDKPQTAAMESSTHYSLHALPADLQEGDYVFKAQVVVARYHMPVTDVQLFLSVGAEEAQKQKLILLGIAAAMLFGGFFLLYITVPPELRVACARSQDGAGSAGSSRRRPL